MKSVIRWMLRTAFSPPRCIYEKDNTVSVITAPNYQVYYRTNFEFTVKDGVTITGSIWRDHEESNPNSCVIFLHSLGTNQFEVLNIIPILCSKQLCIVSFDFPGCGMSGGDILPLDGSGAEIVKNCVEKLKNDYHISKFALWGRSMGAAVALQSVSIYNEDFQCVVSDSAFSCTEKILFDQGKANGFPSFMISMIMPMIKKEAQDAFKTNVDNPFPIGYVSDARAPLLMGHGKQDVFVPLHHAELLFQKYGMNNKQLYFFGGKHNSPRPGQWYQTAARFINRHMGIDSPPRVYDVVFRASQLHVGPVNMVLPEVLRVNAINMQHEQEYRNQLEQNDLRAREKNLQQLNRQLQVNAGNANPQSQNSYSSSNSEIVDSLQAYQEKVTRDEMSQPIVNNTDQAQGIKGSHKKHSKKDKKKSKKDTDKKHKKGHKDQKHRHESKTDETTTSTNSVDPSYTTENSKEITSTTNEISTTTNVPSSTTNETSTLTNDQTTKNNDSSAKNNDPSTSSAIIKPNIDTKEKTNHEKEANESTANAHQYSRSGTPKKDKRAHLTGACSAPITDLNISAHLKAKSEALLTDDETSSYSSLEDDKKENTKEIPTMKHKSSHHRRSHGITKSHSMNLCTLGDQKTQSHRSTASDNDDSTDEMNRRRKHHRSSSSHSARLTISQEGERSHHSRHGERTSAIHSARESGSSHEKRRRRHSSITSPDQDSASDDSCLSENGSSHHGHHHHSRRRKSNADESITSTLEENSKLISNLDSDNPETGNTIIAGKESKNNTGLISDSD